MLPLATFVHISDLHIGIPDPRTGNAMIPADVFGRRWLRRFDGAFGHRLLTMRQLDDFIASMREHQDAQEEPAQLLVTGDLTSFGHHAQFDTAHQYIVGQWRPSPVLAPLGLDAANGRDWSIPGNHDCWPGKPTVLGHPTPALRATLPTPPPVHTGTTVRLPTGHVLRFIRMDSDADVHPFGVYRMLAWGDMASEFVAADDLKLLPPRPEHEIRVLLVHHSWHCRSWRLRFTPGSRQRLERFLRENEIAVMLSGHLHVPLSKIITIPGTGSDGVHRVLEARCGTTTRRDKLKPRTAKVDLTDDLHPGDAGTCTADELNQVARLGQNTLLLHTVELSDAGLIWRVKWYRREHDTGFVPMETPQRHVKTMPIWP